MAFSLEAMATVPLLFSLILRPVKLGPSIGQESIDQAKSALTVTRLQVNPPTFYRFVQNEHNVLTGVQASPQLMLELIGLAKDVWQPFSELIAP